MYYSRTCGIKLTRYKLLLSKKAFSAFNHRLTPQPVEMASSVARMSRDEHRKNKEIEEMRKAGTLAPEIDEDGNMINPHIPQYMSQVLPCTASLTLPQRRRSAGRT